MYFLGVDFGGGASKATLIDEKGKVISTATAEYPTFYGEDGKAEQNPLDWYNAACTNIKKVIKNVDAQEIACLCFDAATHTAVLMDEKNAPVSNAIYWTDTRCTKEKNFLSERYGKEIFEKCKHEVDTIWSLPEILYFKNNYPEKYQKVKKITFAKDFVRGMFTGDFVTDYVEAQGSMLFDFDKHIWDEKLLSLIGMTVENMPKIVDPLDFVGYVCEKAAKDSGLYSLTKVICGATDTAMEIFSAGAVNRGDMTVKLATAGRICVISDNYFADKNVINYEHLKKGLYYPGSATKSCAASLRWFRDAFGGDYEEYNQMAEKIAIGCEGLIFHPYLTGELTPHANPKLSGSFVGVKAGHSKGHFVRAVMEGVAMSLLDCKRYLEERGVKTSNRAYIIGGGAKSKIWRQIVADALDLTLITLECCDSSFGSAMCSAIAVGAFEGFDDAIKKCQVQTGKTLPIKENTQKYQLIFKKYKKISAFLADLTNEE